MIVYTILMVACLAAEPTDCRHYQMPVEASAIPTAAFMDAQAHVASWQAQHPGWAVVIWRMVNGRPV